MRDVVEPPLPLSDLLSLLPVHWICLLVYLRWIELLPVERSWVVAANVSLDTVGT